MTISLLNDEQMSNKVGVEQQPDHESRKHLSFEKVRLVILSCLFGSRKLDSYLHWESKQRSPDSPDVGATNHKPGNSEADSILPVIFDIFWIYSCSLQNYHQHS